MTLFLSQVPRRSIASRQMPTLSLVGLVADRQDPAFTHPQRVKSLVYEVETLLVDSLKSFISNQDLTIVRAKEFNFKQLPMIAVGVSSVSTIPDAAGVKRFSLDVVFASNECTPQELAAISEMIEFELIYQATEESNQRDGVAVYDIKYAGSSQEWDGTTILVNFNIECLAARS